MKKMKKYKMKNMSKKKKEEEQQRPEEEAITRKGRTITKRTRTGRTRKRIRQEHQDENNKKK